MKITDVTLTLFAWDAVPATTYGHHSARPTGKSDLGLLRLITDEGIEGHAFLGTSSNPASLDGPALIHFLKPIVVGQNQLDRERLHKLLWARARATSIRVGQPKRPARRSAGRRTSRSVRRSGERSATITESCSIRPGATGSRR